MDVHGTRLRAGKMHVPEKPAWPRGNALPIFERLQRGAHAQRFLDRVPSRAR
jgi:hypothetical protein